jgi:hypothetical protein
MPNQPARATRRMNKKREKAAGMAFEMSIDSRGGIL